MNKKAKRLEIYRERGLSKQTAILGKCGRNRGAEKFKDFRRLAFSVFVCVFAEKRPRKTLKGSSYFLINVGLTEAKK